MGTLSRQPIVQGSQGKRNKWNTCQSIHDIETMRLAEIAKGLRVNGEEDQGLTAEMLQTYKGEEENRLSEVGGKPGECGALGTQSLRGRMGDGMMNVPNAACGGPD